VSNLVREEVRRAQFVLLRAYTAEVGFLIVVPPVTIASTVEKQP
jgi:hypothetical protein